MSVELNATNFPDAVFRNYLSTTFDLNQDGTLSDAELAAITSIQIQSSSQASEKIGSLQGIQYLTALESFILSGARLGSADFSFNTALTELQLDSCELASITLGNLGSLLTLVLSNNYLTALNLHTVPALSGLHVAHNRLTKINISHNLEIQNEIRLLEKKTENGIISYGETIEEQGQETSDFVAFITIDATVSWLLSELIIVDQPNDVEVFSGDLASFSIEANDKDISYQWQVQEHGSDTWSDIIGAGAKTNKFIISSVAESQSGNRYRCRINSDITTVYSDPALLTVRNYNPPKILHQPNDVTVINGEEAVFYVSASGANLQYQWQKKINNVWTNIAGKTQYQFSFTATSELNQSEYRCFIENSDGSVYTKTVMLVVNADEADPISLENSGYHSIYISGKNTYFEWEMYPTSRPHVAPPEVKTSYVDLPGAHSGLDYTELLTGAPKYGYRKGSWEFMLIPQERWGQVYRDLVAYFHGRQHTIILEDDPRYKYTGRLSVNEWQSAAHNSLITIDYILEPFPAIVTSQDDPSPPDDREDYIAAARILNKPENRDKTLILQDSVAVLAERESLFDDGDSILY